MKLNEYAKRMGIAYDTALAHYHRGMIPGAMQLETGTIIVPDMLADGAAQVAASMQLDLTADDAGNSAAPRKGKSQTDMLRAQLEAMQQGASASSGGFSPADYMNAGAVLPPKAVKAVTDYEAEWARSLARCTVKVEAIISNFIQDQEQLALPKVAVMVEEHAEKLAELAYATERIKRTLFDMQAALDAGEPVERAYELQATYLTQLQNASNNRTKFLASVEEYWAGEAHRLGFSDVQRQVAEVREQEQEVQQAADEQLFTADARTINDSMDDIMKKLKEEGFAGK